MDCCSVYKTMPHPDTCIWIKGTCFERGVVVGSYKLDEETQSRSGFISLYEHRSDKLKVVDMYKCDFGVLALRKLKNSELFISGNSCGTIGAFYITNKKIMHMTTCSVETERSEKLQVLSVYPIKDRVWFSTASGGVGMVKLVESSYILVSKFDASKFESWSVVSHPRSIDVAYASDDFGSIRIFDARTSKISQFTKYHHYGVCSLSFPEQVNDNLVCSGGFDHTLCFWDTRSTDKPISNFQPGYCVWAIRWFSPDKIALVSANDSGSYILKFDQNYQKHSEAIHYDRPQSLVYSSEICKVHTNNSSSYRICSTSFYDSLLHLWNFNTGLLKKRLYDQM